MKYFKNITTLSELKKAFRALVIANHPDKGGSLEAMQEINAEFEKLYNSLKDCKETTNTGYETDYQGATAKEYTQHVYEEYGWTGKNYTGEHDLQKLAKIFRDWLRKVYPSCKFSVVTSRGYRTVQITLSVADFNPFTGENKKHYDISRYDVETDPELTDRAKDMFSNIRNYVNTYNYDHSDLMADYYDTNFYTSLAIGQYENPFKIEIPKERRANGAAAPSFHWEDGPAHKALKKALGKHYFAKEEFKDGAALVLGDTTYYNGKEGFSPLYRYCSGITPARRCIEKLASIGVICELFHGCVKFVGYTSEMEQALKEEDEARVRAFKEWQDRQNRKQEDAQEPEQKEAAQTVDGLEIVDYSEKAVAVFGETMEIKEHLKALGGKFNPSLRYGNGKRAGWVFPKSKREELERLAKPEASEPEPGAIKPEDAKETPADVPTPSGAMICEEVLNKYQSYPSVAEEMDGFKLGEVVFDQCGQVGVILAFYEGGEARTDSNGVCSTDQLKKCPYEIAEKLLPYILKGVNAPYKEKPKQAGKPLTIRANRKGCTLRGDDATRAAEVLGLKTESTPDGVPVLRFDALYIDSYITRLIRHGQRVRLSDEPEEEPQPEHHRPPMNGQAFTSFSSCLQKRLQQNGSEAGRRYAKRMCGKYGFTFQQLRYTAYLIREYATRSGETFKPVAA